MGCCKEAGGCGQQQKDLTGVILAPLQAFLKASLMETDICPRLCSEAISLSAYMLKRYFYNPRPKHDKMKHGAETSAVGNPIDIRRIVIAIVLVVGR